MEAHKFKLSNMDSHSIVGRSDSSGNINRAVATAVDLTRSKSLQLSVRGQPTAFDISPGNELMCVASPGCLTFFHLNGLGSPRHVIHYEQPKQIRAIRYQKTGNLAGLRAGIISLWDTTNSLRPLIGLLQSPGYSIVDLQWSNFNHNLLGASFQAVPNAGSGCGLLAWDVRSPATPSHSITLQGRNCVGVEWGPSSSNSNIIGACVDYKRILLYDTRMVGANPDRQEPASVIEPRTGVHHFCWSKWADESLVVVSTTAGSVEWWSVNGGVMASSNSAKRLGAIKPGQVDAPCTLLPAPLGKAVVTCYPRYVDCPQNPSAQLLSQSGASKKALNQVLTLQGFPADRLPLESLFLPASAPSMGSSTSTKLPSNDEFGEGPSASLASCTQRLLGLKWGTPGRLVPPFHGGFELIMLTESAILHAVKVPLESVKKCCWAVEAGLPSYNAAAFGVGGIRKDDVVQLNSDARVASSSTVDLSAIKKGPRYLPGGGADRSTSLVSGYSGRSGGFDHKGNGNDTSWGIDEFWSQMQSAVLSLEEAIATGQLRDVTLGRIDQYARQLTLETMLVGSHLDVDEASVSLVISFPPDFPASSIPVFSVEGYLQVHFSSDFLL